MDDPSPKPLVAELLDVQCKTRITPRLVPWLYAGSIGLLFYAIVWLDVWAFRHSMWLGWLHVLLVSPLTLGMGVMLLRAVLEVGVAILEIRAHAGELGELPRRLSSWPAMRRIVALGESRVWSPRRDDSQP